MPVTLPPVDYDHRPTIAVVEVLRNPSDIPGACRGAWNTLACSTVLTAPDGTKVCYIVLPTLGGAITEGWQHLLRRHEWGHCNGIGMDHKGYRP